MLAVGMLAPVDVFPDASVLVIPIGQVVGIRFGVILNVPLPVTVPVPIIAPTGL